VEAEEAEEDIKAVPDTVFSRESAVFGVKITILRDI